MEHVVLNEVILIRCVDEPDGSAHWVYDGKERCRVEFDILTNSKRERIGHLSDATQWSSETRNGREIYWWTCLATRTHIERAFRDHADAILEPGRDLYAVRCIEDDGTRDIKRRRRTTRSDRVQPHS
jgi:hypothetical protein